LADSPYLNRGTDAEMNAALREKFAAEEPQSLQVFLLTSTVTEVNAYPAHAIKVYRGVDVKLHSF
jgi:hypothetical protein